MLIVILNGNMGQCQHCCHSREVTLTHQDKEDNSPKYKHKLSPLSKQSDSALESDNSSDDSCAIVNITTTAPRNSNSSESSGKFSFRGSSISCSDCDGHHSVSKCPMIEGLPEYKELNGSKCDVFYTLEENYYPRQVSRNSVSSDRGSAVSDSILRVKMGRSSSLKEDEQQPYENSYKGNKLIPPKQRTRRAVSLRLPRSQWPKDNDSKVPTFYVDDPPATPPPAPTTRTIPSLKQALSSMSLNSLLGQEGQKTKNQKPPVQRILRQPTRRHQTVRGMSGLAIDGSNRQPMSSGLNRAHTLYYPTATSMRAAYGGRRTVTLQT